MSDPELEAMQQVHAALADLDGAARARVIQWAADRFELGTRRATRPGDDPPDVGGGDRELVFRDVGDLVHATEASTGPQRALAVAYWFQELEGRDGWGAGELNDALKNLGSGLANVTKTLSSLSVRKPALVMQVGKSGRSRQARKTYKLTAAGIREVQGMLERDRNASS